LSEARALAGLAVVIAALGYGWFDVLVIVLVVLAVVWLVRHL
jgi:hypothetical protein